MANKTVTVGDGKTYSSLNAALATESTDLINTLDGILTIECYHFDSKDTTAANTGTGYTTDADHYIKIIAIDKHQGVRPTPTSHYCLETTSGYTSALIISEDYTRIIGFAGKAGNTEGNGVRFNSPSSNTRVIDVLCYDCNRAGFMAYGGGPIYLNNCIALGCGTAGTYGGFDNYQTYFMYAYNCVSVGGGYTGFGSNYFPGTMTCKNCYSGGNASDDYYGSYITVNSDCRSEDGTKSTTTAAYSTTSGCYFTNVTTGSENVKIKANSELINVGTDLGGDSYWVHPDGEVDIVGASRAAGWDIGAFEYAEEGVEGYGPGLPIRVGRKAVLVI